MVVTNYSITVAPLDFTKMLRLVMRNVRKKALDKCWNNSTGTQHKHTKACSNNDDDNVKLLVYYSHLMHLLWYSHRLETFWYSSTNWATEHDSGPENWTDYKSCFTDQLSGLWKIMWFCWRSHSKQLVHNMRVLAFDKNCSLLCTVYDSYKAVLSRCRSIQLDMDLNNIFVKWFPSIP